MKVLLADRLPETTIDQLEALGLEVASHPDLDADALPAALVGHHILVVRSTKVTQEAINAADALQRIVRAGAGVNTIDTEAAAKRAIHVCNCPGKNAVAVAELTMGLLLAVDRAIPDNVRLLREGQWEKKRFSKGKGLHGRTLGIIGMGRIGQEVVTRAQAFGMHCVAWSRSLSDQSAQALGVRRCESPHEVCALADAICVHVALTEDTRHLIGAEELAAMKDGSVVIHAARGGVVDDSALAHEVASGRLRAASDVYEDEPKGGKGSYEGCFKELEGFYGTHHIGASTVQAQHAIGDEVVRIVAEWLGTGEALNCVNRKKRSPARGQLLVRHLDQVGALARVLDVISAAAISVKDMHNTIFDNTGAAVASITLARAPSQETLDAVREQCPQVLGVVWIAFEGESTVE